MYWWIIVLAVVGCGYIDISETVRIEKKFAASPKPIYVEDIVRRPTQQQSDYGN